MEVRPFRSRCIYRQRSGMWRVLCRIDGRLHHVGCYRTREEAVAARNRFWANIFGEHFFEVIVLRTIRI